MFLLTLFFTSGTLAAERYAVTTKIANIRSGPGTNHEIMIEAEKYYPFNLLKKHKKEIIDNIAHNF